LRGLALCLDNLTFAVPQLYYARQRPIYASVDDLFDAYNELKLRSNPTGKTSLGANKYNDTIANYLSTDYRASLVEEDAGFLEAIAAFDGRSSRLTGVSSTGRTPHVLRPPTPSSASDTVPVRG
jgi:hypothetical protein